MPEESVRPLERGLAVLRALAAATEPLRAGDLVRATELARSTVDRVVATLVLLGFVRQRGQELVLTPRLMELGNAFLSASGLTAELTARTARLADELDESVSLAVPDRDGVRFIAQATRRRTMSVSFRVGDLLPAERCAPGALFAAGWDARQWAAWRSRAEGERPGTGPAAVAPRRTAEAEAEFAARAARADAVGWALDDQLIEPGLIAVSVPVPGPGGVRHALSAVSHTSRHTAQGLAEAVLPRLRAEAAHLAAAFADAPAPGTPAGGETGNGARDRAPGDGPGGPARGPAADTAFARDAKAAWGPGFLQSLARGLGVLRALGAARGGGLPLTALAEATGLPRATARRCLHTLFEEGYAAHDGRLYRPLPKVLELGYARLAGLSFAELTEPHLRDLVARVHETASVAVLDGTDVVYIARVPAVRIVSLRVAPGTRFPAYPTALGRVLLAALSPAERERVWAGTRPRAFTRHTVTSPARLERILSRVAEDGYAAVDQELEAGLRSVAVPLRDADGQVVAALNAALHAGDAPLYATRDALLPALRDAAAAIEADLRTATRFVPVQEL